MTRLIAQIVEGFGEVESLPQILQRRLAAGTQIGGAGGGPVWPAYPPINARGRGNLITRGGIEENVRIAKRIPDVCGILVVLDAEEHDVCPLGPQLQARAEGEAPGLPVRICLANRQFENWIAACDINGEAWQPVDNDFEGPGAEESIKARMPNRRYKKTTHQSKLTAAMVDELAASRCPSYARLLRCVNELVALC